MSAAPRSLRPRQSSFFSAAVNDFWSFDSAAARHVASSGWLFFSAFARGLSVETAFDVLAVARQLKARGKDVIELQIGDSPFPTTEHARAAGIKAIEDHASHYCASLGLPEFRAAIARNYAREFGVAIGPEHVVVGPGAKVFEQFFCKAFLDPGDAVLVFTPHFPTFGPNIERPTPNTE